MINRTLKTKTQLKRNTPLRSKKPTGSKSAHIEELDTVFQFYIRLRDSRPDGRCQCISCGKVVDFRKIQAGHFRSRSHMSTRWSELNVNGECESCNLSFRDGDHLLDYRRNLIRKIGEQKVEWIEAYCHQERKWSDFELVLMIKEYAKKCAQLSKEKEIPLSQKVERIIKKYSK